MLFSALFTEICMYLSCLKSLGEMQIIQIYQWSIQILGDKPTRVLYPPLTWTVCSSGWIFSYHTRSFFYQHPEHFLLSCVGSPDSWSNIIFFHHCAELSGSYKKKSANVRDKKHDNPVCETAKETQMYRTDFWTLWERERVGWFGRMALKHV